MLEFDRFTGFDWDSGNANKSLEKHGVSRAEAEQVFFNDPLLIYPDLTHSQAERRSHALGKSSSDRLLFIAFTLRRDGALIRVISARDMNRKERDLYEKEA